MRRTFFLTAIVIAVAALCANPKVAGAGAPMDASTIEGCRAYAEKFLQENVEGKDAVALFTVVVYVLTTQYHGGVDRDEFLRLFARLYTEDALRVFAVGFFGLPCGQVGHAYLFRPTQNASCDFEFIGLNREAHNAFRAEVLGGEEERPPKIAHVEPDGKAPAGEK